MEDPEEPPASGREVRQPYEKPAISWEEPLEVRANLMSACAKIAGQSSACDSAVSS